MVPLKLEQTPISSRMLTTVKEINIQLPCSQQLVVGSYSEPDRSNSPYQAIVFTAQFYSSTYAYVSQGFLYRLVTCYTILYLLCSPPVTSSWIWINELMCDEYLLYSITQRTLPYVTPGCYDAGLLMNIQHRTNLSINICRFPHNIYTTVILKLNSITLTHFSLSSRDSWRKEYYYYNLVFEIFTALFPDVTFCLSVNSRGLFETLVTDHPWTRHTPAELNPLLLQFTVSFKSITSCKTIRLPSCPPFGNPCWSNICVRMYFKKILNAIWRIPWGWVQKSPPKRR
jgi:hypothetical protein